MEMEKWNLTLPAGEALSEVMAPVPAPVGVDNKAPGSRTELV